MYITSINMAANGLTKPLMYPQFYAFLKHLQMVQELN